jgi:pimeloyl-[acyl-carrier protein] methyl ester esterase
VNLHIDHYGDPSAQPLVLLHGWAMHGGIFAGWAAQLAAHFHVLVVDLPGHGHSRTLTLSFDASADQLIVQLKPYPSAIWCGWSLGGALATRIAARAPAGQVRALVCIASNPKFVASADWPDGMQASVFASFAEALASDWQAVVQRFLALEAMGSASAGDSLRLLQAQVFARGQPSMSALQQGLQNLAELDLRAELASLRCRSLWIAGARDRLVSPSAMQKAAGLANGEFAQIDRAGHAPFLHAGEQLVELFQRFVVAK